MTTPAGFPPQRTPFVLQSLLTQLKDRADTTRVEAITGRAADPAAKLGGRVAEVIGIERALADIAGYREAIALAETRAGASQTSINGLRDMTDDLANTAAVALQSGLAGGLTTLSETAQDLLGSAIGALNISIGGRALFSGDAGDTTALADAETFLTEVRTLVAGQPDGEAAAAAVAAAFDDPGGLFETLLYGGGTGGAPAAEIAPGERVSVQARADEQPFRDILRAIATIVVANEAGGTVPADMGRALAEDAVGVLRSAVDPLNRVAARIGSSEERIADMSARYVAEEARLTLDYNAFVGRDALEAATQLQEVEGQLEILFLSTARFSQLSLANFLR